MHPQSMSYFEVKGHLSANLIERNNTYFQHIIIIFNREKIKYQQRLINVKLYFKIIRLAFCDFSYSRWHPKWLPDYYTSDTVF